MRRVDYIYVLMLLIKFVVFLDFSIRRGPAEETVAAEMLVIEEQTTC